MTSIIQLALVYASFTLGTSALAAGADQSAQIRVINAVNAILADGKALHAGDFLKEDSEIKTGAARDSLLDLKYPEGHQVRIKANADVQVVALKKRDNALKLLKGQVFVHVIKDAASETKFEVRTPSIVAGVRGTEFVTEYSEEKGSYLCVCDGVVGVKNQSGGAEVAVKEGQDIWSHKNGSLEAPKDSPSMKSMTQQEFDKIKF